MAYDLNKMPDDGQVVIVMSVQQLRLTLLSVYDCIKEDVRRKVKHKEVPIRQSLLPDLMTFGNARAELEKKGYRVKSNTGLKAVLDRYKVKYEKRGKQCWIKKTDFLKIPDNSDGRN